jgi:hypothetical protein
MSYFDPLKSLPDYPEAEGNFRFSYNANSGGGQSFLAGKFKDKNGALADPKSLDGKVGVFKFAFNLPGRHKVEVLLDNDTTRYLIKPRGANNNNMKLEVQGKDNPSKLITAFLMLPEGCTIGNAANPANSILTKGNYWLQVMRLTCEQDAAPNSVHMIPTDLVFAGSVTDEGGTSNEKFFRLDFERRARDIISASQQADLPESIRKQLSIFAEIYTGNRSFSFRESQEAIVILMRETAIWRPTRYSGIDDPLPALVTGSIRKSGGTMKFQTGLGVPEKRNLIIFGAPGTGKSKLLDQRKDALLKDGGLFERVTFHPDYSYAHFVGTYKPVPRNGPEGEEQITYEYVPGPFMRVFAAALNNGKTSEVRPHLLLIEEINRASAAAVFGDIFQLLDRNQSNVSEYPIHASIDVQNFLSKAVGGLPTDYEELRLPDNMFIWGSMNSADQGVFPIDTAFKRRWNFLYLGIDDNEKDLKGKLVSLGKGEWERVVEWNELRKLINNFLAEKGINEDKQLGPYFLSREICVPLTGNRVTREPFVDAFQEKVLMYLFEDAARHHRASVFAGCDHKGNRYSNIRADFETRGVYIFHSQIVERLELHQIDDQLPDKSGTQ